MTLIICQTSNVYVNANALPCACVYVCVYVHVKVSVCACVRVALHWWRLMTHAQMYSIIRQGKSDRHLAVSYWRIISTHQCDMLPVACLSDDSPVPISSSVIKFYLTAACSFTYAINGSSNFPSSPSSRTVFRVLRVWLPTNGIRLPRGPRSIPARACGYVRALARARQRISFENNRLSRCPPGGAYCNTRRREGSDFNPLVRQWSMIGAW